MLSVCKRNLFCRGLCRMYKKETAPHTIDGVERMLTRFQLHDFMCKFGDKITFGSKNVIVDNNLFYGLEG